MKEQKPTIRDIKSILKDKNIHGWNDKRCDGGRIKLGWAISHQQQHKLEKELAARYPQYEIACGNMIWNENYSGRRITTAVYFKQHFKWNSNGNSLK